MPGNAPEFTLKVGSLPADTFFVLSFEGREKLSACPRFTCSLAADEMDFKYEDVIGKPVTLISAFQGKEMKFHGVAVEFQELPQEDDYVPFELHFVPKLQLLEYSTSNRVFQNLKIEAILEEVLTKAGFKGDDYTFELSESYTTREYTVQYNETDLNFIQRLMEHEGIYYFFDHRGSAEKVVFADNAPAVKPFASDNKIKFHPDVGLNPDVECFVNQLRKTQRMVTGSVTIKDYYDQTPGTTILGKATGKGQGEHYHFSDNVRNTTEASQVAKLRADMFAGSKIVYEGRSNVRGLRPGFRFDLKDHGRGRFDGSYHVVTITHKGSQGTTGGGGGQYHNAFSCIPADIVFRPALDTPKPKISGVISATVDGANGKYAPVDDQGRYRLKMPFDLSDLKDGKATLPVRMAQPHSGPNYGMHFPVHQGTEIIVGFVDGDVDRPIGLGTAPNPSQASPVKSGNASQNIIRTASGHQIVLEDKEKNTAMELTTSGKHSMAMNDNSDTKEIRVRTTDGNEMVLDDTNKNILIQTTDSGHVVKLDNDKKTMTLQTKYGHLIKMADEDKVISIQTKDGNILMLDDANKLLTLQDGKKKHVIQIDAGSGLVSISTDGDIEMKAKGAFNLEAKEISMNAKQGGVNMKAAKDIALDGMNINVKAKQKVALEATKEASIKATAAIKLDATKIESAAKVANKVSGTTVSVEASGINAIKGSLVKIN